MFKGLIDAIVVIAMDNRPACSNFGKEFSGFLGIIGVVLLAIVLVRHFCYGDPLF